MKYILLFIAVFCAVGAFAQDQSWLGQVFGEETYETMLESAPEKIDFYIFLDAEGHIIQDVAPKSIDQYPDALQVTSKVNGAPELTLELMMSEDFHPMMYNFDRRAKETMWYRVGETSYLITFLPSQQVRKDFLDAQ